LPRLGMTPHRVREQIPAYPEDEHADDDPSADLPYLRRFV
jgi:hypothetical protein